MSFQYVMLPPVADENGFASKFQPPVSIQRQPPFPLPSTDTNGAPAGPAVPPFPISSPTNPDPPAASKSDKAFLPSNPVHGKDHTHTASPQDNRLAQIKLPRSAESGDDFVAWQ